jgi:hypothetical protein
LLETRTCLLDEIAGGSRALSVDATGKACGPLERPDCGAAAGVPGIGLGALDNLRVQTSRSSRAAKVRVTGELPGEV